MNKKNELLSIGELAKISDASIKSLRYYEKIGILTPAYVNPESGYRYYSLSQLHIVEVIQICVELNIPLKDLDKFINPNQSINYSALLDYGEKLAEKKIQTIQKGLEFIHLAQEEVTRVDKYKDRKKPYTRSIPEKLFYVLPYHFIQGERALYTEVNRLFQEATKDNIELFYEWGILYEYFPNEIKRYIFMEVMPTTIHHENIKRIPSGDYMCTFAQGNQIERAPELFPELFKNKDYVLAIETEVFVDNFQENQPTNELRILLSE